MKAQELNKLQRSAAPCPFCGGPGELAPMPNASGWWRVRCKSYHCGGTTWAIQSASDAVTAWNRRPAGGTS